MKPETKAEGKPENLQDTEVKQQSKKKKINGSKRKSKESENFVKRLKIS